MTIRTSLNAIAVALLIGCMVLPSSALSQTACPSSVLPSGGGQALLAVIPLTG